MKREKWLDLTTGVAWSIVFALVSMAMSIIALANKYPSTHDFDYLGIIVAILTILITFLVGWQIFTLIDLRSTKSDLNQIKNDLQSEIYRTCADIYGDIAFVHGKMGDVFYDTIQTINRIILLSKAGEYKKCDEEISKCILLGIFEEKIGEFKHNLIYKRLNEIPNSEKISKFKDFVNFINEHFPLDEEDVKRQREFRERMKKIKQTKSKH